jgi:putative SOS response-associated peptidase YedK
VPGGPKSSRRGLADIGAVCGRYTLATPDPAQLRDRFPIGESVEVRQRFNVAPGDDVLSITTDRDGRPRGELLRWGLVPSWSGGPGERLKMINARVETVTERPAFRSAFGRFRCLIIADGFYEWEALRAPPAPASRPRSGKPVKQPFHITRTDRQPFAFAGLWSIWRREDSVIRSCAIITAAANPVVARLHDRMPVILDRGAEAAWLDPATARPELVELLASLPVADTALRPVGPAVNDARYDGPECLAPPSPAHAAPPQPSLF